MSARRWRNSEPERLRGLQVDDQLEVGRCLHRQVRRFFTPQDAVDVGRRLPELVDEIGSVGEQPAAGCIEARVVDRGQSVPGSQSNYEIAMHRRCRAPGHDQTSIRSLRERRDLALDLARIAHVDRAHIHAQRRRHDLDCAELARPGRYRRFAKDRRVLHVRCNFFE